MEVFDRELFRLIHLSAEFMSVRKCFDTREVSQAEINVLAGIEQESTCSLKQLADLLEITSSACSQQVERLVKRGLIQRLTDTQDRRGIRLELTGAGQKVMNAYHGCQKSLAEAVSRRLNHIDKKNTIELIDAIAATLEERIQEF